MADWRTRNFVPDSDEEEIGTLSQEQDELSNFSDAHALDHILPTSTKPQAPVVEQIRDDSDERATSTDKGPGRPKEEEDEEEQAHNIGFTGIFAPSDDEIDELALPALHTYKLKAKARSRISLDQLFTSDNVPEDQGDRILEKRLSQQDDPPPEPTPLSSPKLPHDGPDVADEDSSLSDLSSIDSTPPPPSPIASPTQPVNRSTIRSHQEPIVLIQSSSIPRDVRIHQSRSFRSRKPIQLNPFAIEYQRYAKEWQSHGMQPIRVQHRDERQTREDPDADISEPENEESQTQTLGPSTETASLLSPPIQETTIFDVPSSPREDQSEFPDIDTLLRQPLQGAIHDGYKRRKINHTYTKKATTSKSRRKASPTTVHRSSASIKAARGHTDASPARALLKQTPIGEAFGQDPDSRQVQASVLGLSPVLRDLDDSILLTPEQSSPLAPQLGYVLENHDFRSTSFATPQQLQTPIHSSEARPIEKAQSPVIVSSDSDSDQGLPPQRRLSLIEDDRASSNDDVNEHLLRAQRQTKGVLPASWHRLNLKNQISKPRGISKVHKSHLHSPVTEIRKGLARPVSSSNRDANGDQSHSPTAITSSPQSDDGWAPQDFRIRPNIENFLEKENGISIDVISDDDDDDMEEDVIDDMSGPAPRKAHNGKKQITRQRRITDTFRYPRKLNEGSATSKLTLKKSGLKRTSKPSSKYKKSLRPRQRREGVGILDVLETTHQAALPDFLIYAGRTANLRKDKGRHSPSKKVFRMHRQEDTQTIRESLHSWKGGQIKQARELNPRQPRRPLAERTANNAVCGRLDDTEEDYAIFDNTETAVPTPCSSTCPSGNLPPSAFLQQPLSEKPQKPSLAERLRSLHQIRLKPKASTTYVPAQLETERQSRQRKVNFEAQRSFIVDRFLEAGSDKGEVAIRPDAVVRGPQASNRVVIQRQKPQRKMVPRQLDPGLYSEHEESIIQLQEEETPSLPEPHRDISIQSHAHVGPIVGFNPRETEYSITFDVRHLPDGKLFEGSTLIGSGIFASILDLNDAHKSLNTYNLNTSASAPAWREWNETVSDQIQDCFNKTIQALQAESLRVDEHSGYQLSVISRLDTVVHYLHARLAFLDQIDRTVFVERMISWLETVVEALQEVLGEAASLTTQRNIAAVGSRTSLIGFQLKAISDNDLIPRECKDHVMRIFSTAIRQTMQALFPLAFRDFTFFSKDTVDLCLHPSRSKARVSVESFVIVHHMLKQSPSKSSIWELIQQGNLLPSQVDLHDINALERIWRNLVCVLPYMEISPHGTVQKKTLKEPMEETWATVKKIVEPALNAAFVSSSSSSASLRRYCQAVLNRCLHLIQYWRWYNCDSIITCLFDIFAKNNLGDLPGEENRGSPAFLENLSDQLIPPLVNGDRCFNIFLKVVGCGLRGLRSVTQDKRTGNCVFRLVPNHDRRLPKDQDLKKDDLNTVRNQFDLLCVLYWAAPPTYRVRLSFIQQLIDLEASHRQACHLVVKSWSHLVEYQLSTLEPCSRLGPFVSWIKELLEIMLKLHRLARTEVEDDAKTAELSLGRAVPLDARENTIASSQRHIEAIIKDGLQALKRAVDQANTRIAISKHLTTSVTQVLSLFDPKYPRINQVVVDALDVIQAFISQADKVDGSDDSQDYGDPSVFDEIVPSAGDNGPVTLDEGVYKALHSLLSDAFGADCSTNDDFLMQVVKTWLQAARVGVQAGIKTWNRYIDPFGQESWQSLRNTEQKRRLSPFFYATLVELDPSVYEENKSVVLNDWITSLVERESLVKYQPLLTTTLLNQDVTEPLLGNHPFQKSKTSDKFNITLPEFLDRRVSLISYLLSNMRESASFLTYHNLPEKSSTIQRYVEMLRHFMSAMKSNYQSLGHGSEVQSAYVVFVQRVVELHQQYTIDICKVDAFFTDASNFPLPDDDPEYILSHLKNLGLKLNLPGGPQQLSAFLQTMCERTVAKGQQTRSASLLQRAMEDTFESIDQREVNFCDFMIRFATPIYTTVAIESACGWIPATTILAALPPVLDTAIFHLDSFQQASIEKTQSVLFDVLHSVQDAFSTLLARPELLHQPHIFHILFPLVNILSSILEPLEFLSRLDHTSRCGRPWMQKLRTTLFYFLETALGEESGHHAIAAALGETGEDLPARSQLSEAFRSAQKFAADQLKSSLDPAAGRACKWKIDYAQQGRWRYFLLRGGKWEELKNIHLGSLEDERTQFERKVLDFAKRMDRSPSLMAGFSSGGVETRFREQDLLGGSSIHRRRAMDLMML